MVEHIKQFATLLKERWQHSPERKLRSAVTSVQDLVTELKRLDPRDFEPSAQCEFMRVRANLDSLVLNDERRADIVLEDLAPLDAVLAMYRGAGAHRLKRKFPYLHDTDLSAIIERDYVELTLKLFPSGAWKSTVILSGSILEAILLDVLSNPTRLAATNGSTKAASKKGVRFGIDTDADQWTLFNLIETAVDTGVLTGDRADTIDQVLRDYRNFVHPDRERRAKHECTEAEAGLAKYALEGVCNHLEATL